mmetsp:Transcript_40193/g.111689  ORF Transcript_40193/g.111689 Transcript_40193/m.111689 type:complete len:259 (-) Transcript_40193:440-1216(-)
MFRALGSKTKSLPMTSPYMAIASCRIEMDGSKSSVALPARAARTKAPFEIFVASRRQTGASLKRYLPSMLTTPPSPTCTSNELPKDSWGMCSVAGSRSEKRMAMRSLGRPMTDILCAWPEQKFAGSPHVRAMSAPATPLVPSAAPRNQQVPWRFSSRHATTILLLAVPATTGLNALPLCSVNCSGGDKSAMPASRTLPTTTRPMFPFDTSRKTIAILFNSNTFTFISAACVGTPPAPSSSKRCGMNSGGARQCVPKPT